MDKDAKEGGFGIIFIAMILSLVVFYLFDKIPVIGMTIHSILDPNAGVLMEWSVTWGMVVIVFIISIFMSIAQKYGTDQETIKELKAEQKVLQAQMKEFKHDPAKVMELQKELFEFMPVMMKHSMRPMIYTIIPLILLFRWFGDVFISLGECGFYCNTYLWVFPGWVIWYIFISILFSSILRKVFKIH